MTLASGRDFGTFEPTGEAVDAPVVPFMGGRGTPIHPRTKESHDILMKIPNEAISHIK